MPVLSVTPHGCKAGFLLLGSDGAKIGGSNKKEEFGEDVNVCKITSFFTQFAFYYFFFNS